MSLAVRLKNAFAGKRLFGYVGSLLGRAASPTPSRVAVAAGELQRWAAEIESLMSIVIRFGNLLLTPIMQMDTKTPVPKTWHVHGQLEIEIDGRLLPRLGYAGPNDVCFDDWVRELHYMHCRLDSAKNSEYVYDEGEQGQPAYVFRRAKDTVYVSVRASSFSDGLGDPNWNEIPVDYGLFRSAVSSFILDFLETLKREDKKRTEVWWERNVLDWEQQKRP